MFKKILIGAALMVLLSIIDSEALSLLILSMILGWAAGWLVIQAGKGDV